MQISTCVVETTVSHERTLNFRGFTKIRDREIRGKKFPETSEREELKCDLPVDCICGKFEKFVKKFNACRIFRIDREDFLFQLFLQKYEFIVNDDTYQRFIILFGKHYRGSVTDLWTNVHLNLRRELKLWIESFIKSHAACKLNLQCAFHRVKQTGYSRDIIHRFPKTKFINLRATEAIIPATGNTELGSRCKRDKFSNNFYQPERINSRQRKISSGTDRQGEKERERGRQ